MGAVDGLDSHKACILQHGYQLLQLCRTQMIQHGVGQDGNASGPKDDLNGPHGGDFFPGNITGTVVPDIAVEGFLKAFGIAVT